jgi:hypothetical protein
VQAAPTDRIAALIMVGGTTDFESDPERELTTTRRYRKRRSVEGGDLVVDLP